MIYGTTAYGDGTYSCMVVDGDTYPVDSGCMGVVKLSAYEEVTYGQVFVMPVPWTFEISPTHCFSGKTCGGMPLFSIPTAVEDGDEDEDDFCDWTEGWDDWYWEDDADEYNEAS
jgi:hypothetical protein